MIKNTLVVLFWIVVAGSTNVAWVAFALTLLSAYFLSSLSEQNMRQQEQIDFLRKQLSQLNPVVNET